MIPSPFHRSCVPTRQPWNHNTEAGTGALLLVLSLLSCIAACAQSAPQDVRPVAFEAASVRVHNGPLHSIREFASSGPRLTLGAYTPRQLVLEAYGLKDYQVTFARGIQPQDDVYYDILAKADGNGSPTTAEFRLMLQTLLLQRFQLGIHRETQQMPVYALKVTLGGPKFKSSDGSTNETGHFGVRGRNQTIELHRDSMEALAEQLRGSFMIDRPVVDKTGLPGTFDIHLEATPEARHQDDPAPDDISIFTAVQEQLGLKLEPARAPVQILVVDRMETPSAN